ncbi:MAG: M20 metallopeptidase family protein [Flavobacteriales bacterium]
MNPLESKIKELAKLYFDDIVEIRRHLHKHPELSFEEFNTSSFIQEKLNEYGISFTAGIVKTGIVALIEGKNPKSKCIALRADIDALPIEELNTHSFVSKHKGVMHACGHDVHTASLIGVARILNELKHSWEGCVKLIFQPGEEKLPGGASLMINEGVLNNPTVDKIIGQHVSPELECGTLGIRAGKFMASTDEIYIDVIGKGGHAALPEGNINPIVIASNLISNLYERFSQYRDKPSVFSIGVIEGGTAGNIIPDSVSLQGTFRAMNEEFRKEAHKIIGEICDTVTQQFGGSFSLEIKKGYPFLSNDKELTQLCFDTAAEFMGKQNVIEIPKRMTAEDFAYYSHHVPACFYRIGVGSRGEDRRYLHNAKFDVNENALIHSMGVMSWLAINC